jgi:hypothetical protein
MAGNAQHDGGMRRAQVRAPHGHAGLGVFAMTRTISEPVMTSTRKAHEHKVAAHMRMRVRTLCGS